VVVRKVNYNKWVVMHQAVVLNLTGLRDLSGLVTFTTTWCLTTKKMIITEKLEQWEGGVPRTTQARCGFNNGAWDASYLNLMALGGTPEMPAATE